VKEHLIAEARKGEVEKRRGSFEQLLTAYVDHLKARKSTSAAQVAGIFEKHVIKPFPTIAQTKANKIEPASIQRILSRMVNLGLTRQVNKARSYIGAAFAYGGKADNDPRTMAADGVLFDLKANPFPSGPGNQGVREDRRARVIRG
jgi:hypothetical protein